MAAEIANQGISLVFEKTKENPNTKVWKTRVTNRPPNSEPHIAFGGAFWGTSRGKLRKDPAILKVLESWSF